MRTRWDYRNRPARCQGRAAARASTRCVSTRAGPARSGGRGEVFSRSMTRPTTQPGQAGPPHDPGPRLFRNQQKTISLTIATTLSYPWSGTLPTVRPTAHPCASGRTRPFRAQNNRQEVSVAVLKQAQDAAKREGEAKTQPTAPRGEKPDAPQVGKNRCMSRGQHEVKDRASFFCSTRSGSSSKFRSWSRPIPPCFR
jgi:hypothetical protein